MKSSAHLHADALGRQPAASREPRRRDQSPGKIGVGSNPLQLRDARAQTQRQQILQARCDCSPQVSQGANLQNLADETRQLRHASPRDDNRTGLPDHLKHGIESRSGIDMSDVRVHRNSARPAQLKALAYAQGNQIHLGPGQERHLAHEAWHVVQQKQGRVKPSVQAKGVGINLDPGLEREADQMGGQLAGGPLQYARDSAPLQKASVGSAPVVQGVWNIVINIGRFVGREVVKEVARESAMRAAKGKLAEKLAGLENEVLAGLIEAMQNNPELRRALQQARIGAHLQDAAGRLAAPLAEKLQTLVGSALDSLAAQMPDLREEIEAYKARLAETLGESRVVQVVKGTLEVLASTASQVGAHIAISGGIDFIGKQTAKQVMQTGRHVVSENLGHATQAIDAVIEHADVAEKAAELANEALGPLKVIHKPVRAAVKKGFEFADDLAGPAAEVVDDVALAGAKEKLRGVSAVSGLKDVVAESTDDVAKSATETLKKAGTPSTGADLVKHGARAIQVALVLSDIAKAKTYTDSTIALLKPLAAMGGTTLGPVGAVAAPVLLEQILKRLETTIEPGLVATDQLIKTRLPLLGKATSGGYQAAAYVGQGINNAASSLLSATGGLYNSTLSLFYSSKPAQSSTEAPEEERTPPTHTPDENIADPQVNLEIPVELDELIIASLQRRLGENTDLSDID